ncbi:MAG: aminopeptidase P N-terminal domain-containing protein [Bacteroidota bacterium]
MIKHFATLFFLCSSVYVFSQNENGNKTDKKLPDVADYDTDLLTKDFHRGRREALRNLMPDNSMAVFFSNPIRNRSNDVDFEFHQDPNFYYLTGLNEPNAVLLIFKTMNQFGEITTNEIIFVQDRDPNSEVWTGRRLGVEGVKDQLGFEFVKSNKSFSEFAIKYTKYEKILTLPQHNDYRDDKNDRGDVASMVKHFNSETDTLSGKVNKFKLPDLMAQLRQIKLAEEIVLLRKAIEITCEAEMELMKSLKPGMKEYQSEAVVEFVFHNHGAEHEGFPSIQGGGENSCILHYQTNRKTLKSKDLLVSDIGAEYHGYTADVTRTLPVDGKFSTEEAAIYNLVLKAQEAGITQCKPGNKFWDPDAAATRVIAAGLVELGIIKKPEEVYKYFLHRTSHYLGLDVHDPGLYQTLEAGNVITVEPGIYIPEGSDCDPKWWNIGVRIEDDILITKTGYENLSDCVPRTIAEIERIMAQASGLDDFIGPKR